MLSPVNAFAIANLLKLLQLNVNGALFYYWGLRWNTNSNKIFIWYKFVNHTRYTNKAWQRYWREVMLAQSQHQVINCLPVDVIAVSSPPEKFDKFW